MSLASLTDEEIKDIYTLDFPHSEIAFAYKVPMATVGLIKANNTGSWRVIRLTQGLKKNSKDSWPIIALTGFSPGRRAQSN